MKTFFIASIIYCVQMGAKIYDIISCSVLCFVQYVILLSSLYKLCTTYSAIFRNHIFLSFQFGCAITAYHNYDHPAFRLKIHFNLNIAIYIYSKNKTNVASVNQIILPYLYCIATCIITPWTVIASHKLRILIPICPKAVHVLGYLIIYKWHSELL